MKKLFFLMIITLFVSCVSNKGKNKEMQNKVNQYTQVELTSDLVKQLSDNDKQIVSLFYDISAIMDDLFWFQAFGNKDSLLASIKDESTREFALMNYGPWDRLNDNKPFIASFGQKPAGACFYPKNMTKEEFEAFNSPDKTSQYTILKRSEDSKLITVPYHEAFKNELKKASDLLKRASDLSADKGLKKYLRLRAEALLTDDYFESDLAWMDMKTNSIDLVVGPTETYEDALFGYKASYEAYVLLKDIDWSKKLEKYAGYLPQMQKALPVAQNYKSENPASSSDLGAYDVICYAGDCNAGGKTIAINLPNDEKVQLQQGSRRLQLKNAMKYKFEKILSPISTILIDPEQLSEINFNAFFENTMFHEIAHGLGVKNTINGKGTVKDALKETYSSLEEAKADILGLFLISKLAELGALDNSDIKDNYITFLAGIFRSVRFGAADAHGKANMIIFNFFKDKEAFEYNSLNKTYKVNFEKMKIAIADLSSVIITIQGDGNYDAAVALLADKGQIPEILRQSLDNISKAAIPVDLRFIQGKKIAGF